MKDNTKILPKIGEVWRHFKGKQYQILSVSNSQEVPDSPVTYWVEHTETSETLGVYHANFPQWVGAISGKMGEATENGFILLEPAVQVFEKKPKPDAAAS